MVRSSDDLAARVVRAYGGAARWTAARATRGTVRLGGQLFTSKRVVVPPRMEVTTQLDRPASRLDPIDDAGSIGIFEGSHVRLESLDGAVVGGRDHARDGLPGPGRMGRQWDTLDLTYFLGYALWGYNALVRWLLRDDVARRNLGPGVLEVTLPPEIPAHCRTQRFYFDSESALLTRNDYHPEVVTPDPHVWVANLVERHDEWEGIPYPSRRRVKPRPDTEPAPDLTFVSIDVADWRLLE